MDSVCVCVCGFKNILFFWYSKDIFSISFKLCSFAFYI